jgi:hypothetical protein
VWWCITIISALGRLSQENLKLKADLGYIMRCCLGKNQKLLLQKNSNICKIKKNSWTGDMTQVLECLPSKCEALDSNPSTTKKKSLAYL